jgi:hypothetical protein
METALAGTSSNNARHPDANGLMYDPSAIEDQPMNTSEGRNFRI